MENSSLKQAPKSMVRIWADLIPMFDMAIQPGSRGRQEKRDLELHQHQRQGLEPLGRERGATPF